MTKVIEGHPDYYITDYGEVISGKGVESLRVLIPDISNGYPRVTIDGERRYLADLVAETFLEPRKEGYKIFYIDGNKLNCKANNLTWLSQSDIMNYSQYSIEYRRQVLGEWA